jgi:hypothetical protein
MAPDVEAKVRARFWVLYNEKLRTGKVIKRPLDIMCQAVYTELMKEIEGIRNA